MTGKEIKSLVLSLCFVASGTALIVMGHPLEVGVPIIALAAPASLMDRVSFRKAKSNDGPPVEDDDKTPVIHPEEPDDA